MQSGTEGVQEQAQLSEKDYLLGTMQINNIWLYRQIVYAQTRIFPGKWVIHFSLELGYTNRSPNCS